MRSYNFSPGPAALPTEVLEEARDQLLDWQQSGMSVMEVSHRGKAFMQVAEEAEADLRELLGIPRSYKVLFMQGGASAQFSLVPLNLSRADGVVDYINTGHWSKKAIAEARRYCAVNVAADAGGEYLRVPPQREFKLSSEPAYLHYTPNETISGVEFHYVPAGRGVPLVADMSSTILSRPDRRLEIRTHLRRSAKEHRSVGADDRHRARRSSRPCACRDSRGVQLSAHCRRGVATQHAADVRLVRGGVGLQMVEEAGRSRGDG